MNDLSKVLTTGGDGMLGSYVNFGIKTNRRSLDITDLKEVRSVFQNHKPEIVLHFAAETDVDRCERDPEYAYFINSIGTYNIALVAAELGIKVVYISTNAVFDGLKNGPYSETDKPHPTNFYGHSKLLGEFAIKELLDNYLILRVSWMMGGGPSKDQKFVSKIINQLKKDGTKKINVVNDQFGALTYAKDLVEAIKVLINEDKRGIFHLPNSGSSSRYDVAKEIVNILNLNIDVNPVNSSFFNLDASRNGNDRLDSSLNIMRSWQEALREYLESEWK
ncbi:MAG: dTDP-4-dehydrorhamnose reductase [Parcubacteria group bacterium LiPW_41]|nr:MAG: dTDP-4-dehydrorhamnose reductase [Parcubacteria group bacterium LiPW_41]